MHQRINQRTQALSSRVAIYSDTRELLRMWLTLLSPLLSGAVESTDEDSETHAWSYFCYSGADGFQASSKNFRFQTLPQPDSFADTARRALQAREAEATVVEEASSSGEPQQEAASSAVPVVDDGAARLGDMQGTCFFMRVGYWTYEVCPFKRVRQYHSETRANGGAAIHSEFSLGSYDASKDEWRPGSQLYMQHFSSGEEGRSAMVRIICPENKREEDGIVIVHEPKEREYVITLRIAALCTPVAGAAAATAPAPPSPEATAKSKAAAASRRAAAKVAQVTAAREAAEKAAKAGITSPLAEVMMPQARLLAPIRGRCFQVTKDYWSYEFCPMKHVRQFHKEGHRITSEFSLGKYDKSTEARLTLPTGVALPKGLTPHVFAGVYANGTGDRQTTIRVSCAPKNEHTVLGVEEPAVHKYVLEFSSPLACELNCAFSYQPRQGLQDLVQPP